MSDRPPGYGHYTNLGMYGALPLWYNTSTGQFCIGNPWENHTIAVGGRPGESWTTYRHVGPDPPVFSPPPFNPADVPRWVKYSSISDSRPYYVNPQFQTIGGLGAWEGVPPDIIEGVVIVEGITGIREPVYDYETDTYVDRWNNAYKLSAFGYGPEDLPEDTIFIGGPRPGEMTGWDKTSPEDSTGTQTPLPVHKLCASKQVKTVTTPQGNQELTLYHVHTENEDFWTWLSIEAYNALVWFFTMGTGSDPGAG